MKLIIRKILFTFFAILLLLSFNSCNITEKARIIDKNIPMEKQAQIIIADELILTGINGNPVKMRKDRYSRSISVPAGSNSFLFNYYDIEYAGSYYYEYTDKGLGLTAYLEAGNLYYIQTRREMPELKINIDIINKGYTEYYIPSQEDTINFISSITDTELYSAHFDSETVNEREEASRSDESEVFVYPQMGHSGSIIAVYVNPEEKYAWSASNDRTFKKWDIETGRELQTIEHNKYMQRIIFSHDGRFALSCGNGCLDLWDMSSGQNTKSIEAHTGLLYNDRKVVSYNLAELIETGGRINPEYKDFYVPEAKPANITSIAISRDGKMALSGSNDHTMKLWNLETGEEIRTFGHEDDVLFVAFTEDGEKVYSRSKDNLTRLWDIKTGKLLRTIRFSDDTISVSISNDGNYSLSGTSEGVLRYWNMETNQYLRNVKNIRSYKGYGIGGFAGTFTFSSDWKYAISTLDKYFLVWNISTDGNYVMEDDERITNVAFCSDNKTVISWSGTTFKIWDLTALHEIMSFKNYSNSAEKITLLPDGKTILTGTSGLEFNKWNVFSGEKIENFTLHNEKSDEFFTVSSDGKYVILNSSLEKVNLWDLETMSVIGNLSIEDSAWSMARITFASAFSSDNKYAITGNLGGTLNLWDLSSHENIKTFYKIGAIYTISISPDSKYALVGCHDGKLKLIDLEEKKVIKTLKSHSNNDIINSIVFSSDSKYALSGDLNGNIILWDINKRRQIKIFSNNSSRINSLAFLPDENQFISGLNDHTIKLWDINTGEIIKTFTGHNSSVKSAAVNPNGKHFYSASSDGTTRVWDIEKGEEIASFISFTDGEWIVITPDGYYNASPNGDKYLNIRFSNGIYGIDQFAAAFNRPEVVEARLQGKDDPPIVRQMGDIRKPENAPPSVDIIISDQDEINDTAELIITVQDRFISKKENQIMKAAIEITVNGRLMGNSELQDVTKYHKLPLLQDSENEDITVSPARINVVSKNEKLTFSIPVKLDPGNNYIEVIAANEISYGLRKANIYTPETNRLSKGNLYILAAGVSKYDDIQNNNLKLENLISSIDDARDIIEFFKMQEGNGNRFNMVDPLCLTLSDIIKPNKNEILENISNHFSKATSHDTILLFLSGHGITVDGTYYFLPQDTDFKEIQAGNFNSAINADELRDKIDLPGRKIILIDSCNSGGADSNRLVRNIMNRSTVVFTASRSEENAYAAAMKEGGFLTYSIIQGLKGEAVTNGKEVQLIPLKNYVINSVSKLNEKYKIEKPQNPVIHIPDGYRNFVISYANRNSNP